MICVSVELCYILVNLNQPGVFKILTETTIGVVFFHLCKVEY